MIFKKWLMGFWRLTSPKICRSGGKLESQECWWFNSSLSPKVWAKGEMIASFQFISQQVWDPGRANDSLWACRQEKKSMTQSKGCHREIILPLHRGESVICSIQAFSWFCRITHIKESHLPYPFYRFTC